MIVLSKGQLKVVVSFCNDLAKGIFLGTAINQVLPVGLNSSKILISGAGVIMTVVFLLFALKFSKELW